MEASRSPPPSPRPRAGRRAWEGDPESRRRTRRLANLQALAVTLLTHVGSYDALAYAVRGGDGPSSANRSSRATIPRSRTGLRSAWILARPAALDDPTREGWWGANLTLPGDSAASTRR